MNFFESELKKIMGDSAILKDQKYVGRMCYGTIGGDLRARVEFVTLGVSDHWDYNQYHPAGGKQDGKRHLRYLHRPAYSHGRVF